MLAGQVNDARERLLESFAGLSDEDMLLPGVAEDWSVRDILAHVFAWERASTEAYRMMLADERPPLLDLDEEGIEAFNAEHHAATRDASLQEVISELSAAHEEMLGVPRDLDNTKLYAPAPGDEHSDYSIAAWVRVEAAHDEEHADMIEEWRQENGK